MLLEMTKFKTDPRERHNHILRPLHNPSIVIASETKQSHNTLISHEIAASLCSSQ